MTAHTHQTVPTQFVEASGIRFAYRRFGKTGGVPLIFNQHLTVPASISTFTSTRRTIAASLSHKGSQRRNWQIEAAIADRRSCRVGQRGQDHGPDPRSN